MASVALEMATRGATEPPVSRVTDLLDLSAAAFPRRSQSLRPPSHTPRRQPRPGSLEAIPPPLRQPRRTPARGHEQHGKWAAAWHKRFAPSSPEHGAAPRRRPGERLDHVTSAACQRREGEGQRHPRRNSDAQAPRARRAAGDAGRAAGTPALWGFWTRRPLALSRPRDRQLQGPRLAGPGRDAPHAAFARGVRERQAHHV